MRKEYADLQVKDGKAENGDTVIIDFEGFDGDKAFEGGKAESIEIIITEQSPVAGKQLKDIRLPGKALVGVILRGDEAIVPRGNTELLVGDHIVLFSLPESVTKLLNYLT